MYNGRANAFAHCTLVSMAATHAALTLYFAAAT
jgi:hypothetical protein